MWSSACVDKPGHTTDRSRNDEHNRCSRTSRTDTQTGSKTFRHQNAPTPLSSTICMVVRFQKLRFRNQSLDCTLRNAVSAAMSRTSAAPTTSTDLRSHSRCTSTCRVAPDPTVHRFLFHSGWCGSGAWAAVLHQGRRLAQGRCTRWLNFTSGVADHLGARRSA